MDFGIPNLRKAKQQTEKFPHLGVITFEPTSYKKSRRMLFNTKALELLKLDDENVENQVSFSFVNDQIFIANVNGLSGLSEVKLTKSGTISNKKYYDYIKSILNKDEADEVELFLSETQNEYNNVKVFELSLQQPAEEVVDVDLDTIPEVSYDETEVQDTSFIEEEKEVFPETEGLNSITPSLQPESELAEEEGEENNLESAGFNF